MILETRNGLVFHKGDVVGVLRADDIARANGFLYVERLLHEYPNHVAVVDDKTLNILSVSPTTNSDPT